MAFVADRAAVVNRAARRYGPVFAINIPIFGRTVVVADPALVRQVFTASTDDLLNIKPNLSRIMGPGCVFALDRAEHRHRRKLLTPPFHGKSIKNYEQLIEQETLREAANWLVGEEFATLEPMMRLTLNVILRAVFGADGAELDRLREIMPVAQAWGGPSGVRRDRGEADRAGAGGSGFRRAHRHPVADAAQPIRRRIADAA
jgi:cytochrome P450